MKKESWPHNIKCRLCGAKWGIDERAFEVGEKPEESVCYLCKMKEVSPEALEVLKKMKSWEGSIYNKIKSWI
jgi:hypothetical protein